jgi:hypothetical protein
MGPNPPALSYAQRSSSRPRAIKSGALMFSRIRIDSMPLRMTHMLMPQKNRKHTSWGRLMPRKAAGIASSEGMKTARIL